MVCGRGKVNSFVSNCCVKVCENPGNHGPVSATGDAAIPSNTEVRMLSSILRFQAGGIVMRSLGSSCMLHASTNAAASSSGDATGEPTTVMHGHYLMVCAKHRSLSLIREAVLSQMKPLVLTHERCKPVMEQAAAAQELRRRRKMVVAVNQRRETRCQSWTGSTNASAG